MGTGQGTQMAASIKKITAPMMYMNNGIAINAAEKKVMVLMAYSANSMEKWLQKKW